MRAYRFTTGRVPSKHVFDLDRIVWISRVPMPIKTHAAAGGQTVHADITEIQFDGAPAPYVRPWTEQEHEALVNAWLGEDRNP